MEIQSLYSQSYFKFLEGVSLFNTSRISANKLSYLIELGLSVFMQIPGARRAAYFKMNEDTFDFEFKLSLPDEPETYFNKNHEKLVEAGTVGDALGSLQISQFNIVGNEYIFVAPLVSVSGIIGLVEVYIDLPYERSSDDIELSFIKLASIFSNFFASSLNEFTLKEKDHNIKELVDQIVASRTINLAKKQQEIGSKLESLKWNLSMSIPHEVRTPLNQIIGFSNYLNSFVKSEYSDSEDLLEIIGDIQSSAERLRRLFENYLYFANLTMIATNIDEIRKISEKSTLSAESTIFEYANINADKYNRNSDLIVNLVSASVRISEEYLIKVVDEIMDNALKYSDVGTEVKVSSVSDGEFYHITFKDKGRGMTEEQIKRVDAYMQFDRDQYEQQGSGLGLAIVSRIMDLHSGEIRIESVTNEFTEVTIKLPIAKNDVLEYN